MYYECAKMICLKDVAGDLFQLEILKMSLICYNKTKSLMFSNVLKEIPEDYAKIILFLFEFALEIHWQLKFC